MNHKMHFIFERCFSLSNMLLSALSDSFSFSCCLSFELLQTLWLPLLVKTAVGWYCFVLMFFYEFNL